MLPNVHVALLVNSGPKGFVKHERVYRPRISPRPPENLRFAVLPRTKANTSSFSPVFGGGADRKPNSYLLGPSGPHTKVPVICREDRQSSGTA